MVLTGIGLDYVYMICCMNDTRWFYKSVDFGYGAYLSLSRAFNHFDDSVEDVKMPGPSNYAFYLSRRSPLSLYDRGRHAAFVFCTPHHTSTFKHGGFRRDKRERRRCCAGDIDISMLLYTHPSHVQIPRSTYNTSIYHNTLTPPSPQQPPPATPAPTA